MINDNEPRAVPVVWPEPPPFNEDTGASPDTAIDMEVNPDGE